LPLLILNCLFDACVRAIADETKKWGKVIKSAGIKPE
jgi:hypothetical protein